jgi:hypothetical protein
MKSFSLFVAGKTEIRRVVVRKTRTMGRRHTEALAGSRSLTGRIGVASHRQRTGGALLEPVLASERGYC